MKKPILLPLALFFAGCVFYVYYGITANLWVENLPMLGVDAVLVLLLYFLLKVKEELRKKHENE